MKNFGRDFLKLCIAYFGRIALHLFYILPIKNNRIMFISMEGKQYSCNPRYISEYLCNNYGKQFELIWAFKEPEQFEFLKIQGIVICKYRSVKYYMYKLTSKVSVSNYYWGPELPSRKEQFEIQTWHGGGGGTKKASGDDKALKDNWAHYKRYMMDSDRYSLMMASSKTSLKNTIRGAMKFDGPVIGGTPRNDILINQDKPIISKIIYSTFGLEQSIHILLYAPTWRRNINESVVYSVDFLRIRNALQKRFGGIWVIMVRLHPLANREYLKSIDCQIINATEYPDMQELLYVVDAVITDYSSFVWDYSFTYKPCFLYCADLSAYKEDSDFYTPIHTWGFDVCEDNDQLESAILHFNSEAYRDRLIKRQNFCGSFEEGHATEDICRVIRMICHGDGEWENEVPLI